MNNFEELRQTIRTGSAEEKYEAVLKLAECDGDPVTLVDYLLKLMELADESTLGAATRVCSRLGSKAIPSLIAAIGSENVRIRWRAAKALGEIGKDAEAALPALKAALEDEEKRVRIWSAKAIKQIAG